MTYYIGIDIGGTFTDCAVLDEGGRIVAIAKAPTRREEQDLGVMAALEVAASRLDLSVRDLLSATRFFIHGCTVATNAIVERKGVRTALVATRGHEEAIFIGKASQKVAGRTAQEMTHQSHLEKADPPLVPRRLALGVSERMDRNGEIVVELNHGDVDAVVDRLRADGVEAVAVSFLWSFVNSAHEKSVCGRLRSDLPNVYVCASHEVAPILGEYERTATTVANAYVAPRLMSYIARLERHLEEAGYRYPLLLAHCMGGLTTMEEVRTRPLLTLDSGPVSGVLGARFFGAIYGEPNIICADMGGTTFDVALIEDGRFTLDEEPVVDRYTCAIPKVAVQSVGAGGGSIVWIDDNGLPRVGPQSAGADPGPASYGRGGQAPTVTDVNLVLGYIDPSFFLGGEMSLDRDAAERALDPLANRLRMDRVAIAAGAFRIVNAHMADLMRRVSIDRGRDPRRFVLFAYGGAGPLHIAYLARDLGIAKVYVPSFATVFSAMGMLTGGILHSAERSRIVSLPASAAQLIQLEETFGELESQIGDLFDREQVDIAGRSYERFLYMKYRLQPAPLAVPVHGRLDAHGAAEHAVADFERFYRDLYGANAGFRGASLEIVKARVEGIANTVLPALTASSPSESNDPESAVKGRRPVYFTELNQWLEVAVYDGERLKAGMKIPGAAVIERMGDTIVLPSFADAAVDGFGNVVLTVQLN